MVNESENKVKVLTIKGVCDYMGCNRQYFYANYRHKLQPYPTEERRVYYRYDDVEEMKLQILKKEWQKPFEVVD